MSNQISRGLLIALGVVAFLGFLDATYLAVEHYRGVIPPCGLIEGCEQVTTSSYSVVFGVPVALGGSFYYLLVLVLSVLTWQTGRRRILDAVFVLTIFGFLFSAWFVYLQFFVIYAICIYCMFSALTSTALFGAMLFWKFKLRPKTEPSF